MNPRLSRLQPYPFERLRQWFADVTPNPALAPIRPSIGEPRHPTPALVAEALAAGGRGLANYPTTLGAPALRSRRRASRRGATRRTCRRTEPNNAAKFAALQPKLAAALPCAMPDAALYLWAWTPIGDADFARRLQAEQAVTVLPGSFLAREAHGTNPGRGYVRIALVAHRDECAEAVDRIVTFARSL